VNYEEGSQQLLLNEFDSNSCSHYRSYLRAVSHNRPPSRSRYFIPRSGLYFLMMEAITHLSLGSIDLGDVREKVQHTPAVAPLVVVPADELDEVLVQGDTSLGIEDGGGGVAVQVAGDDIVLSVGQDTCSSSTISFSSHNAHAFGRNGQDILPFRGPSAASLMAALISS